MPEVWASTYDGGGFVPRYCHVHIRCLQIVQELIFFVVTQEISLRGRGGEHARRVFESGRGHDALGLLGPACAHPPGVSSELPGFHARRAWQIRLSIANGIDGWHDYQCGATAFSPAKRGHRRDGQP